MDVLAIKTILEKEFPGIALKLVRNTILIENPQDLPKVARFLKDSDAYRLDYLSVITGVDYLTYLESVYHLCSMEKKIGPLVLRVRVPRDKPRIPSLVPIYRGAEYQEREAYDMFGIIYENHPDLRRIFMWEGFASFPLRKDYQQEDSEVLETEDIEWLDKHGAKVPEEMRRQAEELKKAGKRAIAQRPGEAEPA
jgi:NADH/F420H2 dehydrogenase subunit C